MIGTEREKKRKNRQLGINYVERRRNARGTAELAGKVAQPIMRPFYIKQKNGPITPRNMRSPVGRDDIPSGAKMGWSIPKHDWYSTPLIHVNMADIFRMRWRYLHDNANVTLVSMWINLWD